MNFYLFFNEHVKIVTEGQHVTVKTASTFYHGSPCDAKKYSCLRFEIPFNYLLFAANFVNWHYNFSE
jgi:hypothetical protein